MGPSLARVGLELELLAPRAVDRAAVARAVARAVKGRVEYGFKYYSEGQLPDGRPVCLLTDAVRVRDRRGVRLTIVDDNTIRERLPARPRARTLAATDDLRLALLAERVGWSVDPATRLRALRDVFAGAEVRGELFDGYGHKLIARLEVPTAYARVCELVTRPLEPHERRSEVALLLRVARELRLTVPAEAALHAHFDAKPWQSTPRLRRLILDAAEHRAAWMDRLRPNPRCRKLGTFSPELVRVARHALGVPFKTFAAALALAGAKKECDFNLLGVIQPRPRQRTLEVRCLPMSLEADEVLASIATAEALLAAVHR